MDVPEPDRSGTPRPINPTGPIDPRVRIRHELIRVRRQAEAARAEASAARWEASADRLEEMLERLDAGHALSDQEREVWETGAKRDVPIDSPDIFRFESWDAIRRAQAGTATRLETASGPVDSTAWIEPSTSAAQRFDPPHRAVRSPRFISSESDTDPDEVNAEVVIADETIDGETIDGETIASENDDEFESDNSFEPIELIEPVALGETNEPVGSVAASIPAVQLDTDSESESAGGRRRPLAFLVSAAIHFLLLLIMTVFTLTTVMPKDQVALSASVSESNEAAVQTFQIESVEPLLEPVEAASETQYDVSPVGTMAAVDVTSDLIAAINRPISSMASLAQPVMSDASTLKALKSDSESKMEFCGVEGGGNHFVYLVDSSGSMGDAFVSARRALLDSIDMLGPQQRFYVIFFDAQCDYMRISRADQDEPRSVHATDENKQRLKAWAMRVAMDRGRAPYEPLRYAIEKLKPDVIFLLSDGEFPQGIEDLLSETNQVSNLFGEVSPVSIIHTISYFSREGEARMRRIAETNHGQYRYVPQPASR